MEVLSQEDFLSTLDKLKKTHPDVYNNKRSRYYIDMEKAKSIIKLVLKNDRLNKFLISGFFEKYVAFIYKNKDEIMKVPEEEPDDDSFYVRMPVDSFRRILSRIVIDDVHLSDDEVEKGCKAYVEFLKRKSLYSNISTKLLEEYTLFVYRNRYAIRKLVSKELNHVKMDREGNYILHDEDFVGKINCDGGHNSPLWICINIADAGKSGKHKKGQGEPAERKVKEFIDERITRIKEFPDRITDIIVKREEERVIKHNNSMSSPVKEEVSYVPNKNIKNDIVVKNMLPENQRETALIAEEIARELGLPVAQYYPARYVGTMYTKEQAEKRREENGENLEKDLVYMTERIVLTPNFLEEGEELITGDRIAKYEMDVSVVPELIRNYLRKEGVVEEKIESLVSDYRIIMAFNCFINHRDCHNGNWGFIKKADGEYKISHIFDLEGSLDENVNCIRAIYIGDEYSEPGKNIDYSLLMNLMEDEKCREKMKEIFLLDLNKVFANVNISKGISISKKKQVDVISVIGREKQIFDEVYRNINKNNDETCTKSRFDDRTVGHDDFDDLV